MAAKILKNKVNKHPNHGMDTSSEESYRPQMKLQVDLSSNKLSGQQECQSTVLSDIICSILTQGNVQNKWQNLAVGLQVTENLVKQLQKEFEAGKRPIANIIETIFIDYLKQIGDSTAKVNTLICALKNVGYHEAEALAEHERLHLKQFFNLHKTTKDKGDMSQRIANNNDKLLTPIRQAHEPLISIEMKERSPTSGNPRKSKQSFYCSLSSPCNLYFVLVGFALCFIALGLILFVCIFPLFAMFNEKSSTDLLYNATHYSKDQDGEICLDAHNNQSFRYISEVDSTKDNAVGYISTVRPPVLSFDEIGKLTISGNIKYEHLLDILSSTNCVHDLMLENLTLVYQNHTVARSANLRSENCRNVLSNLEKLHLNKECLSSNIWVRFNPCKMSNLKEISITNMQFNERFVRFFVLLQASSPNLNSLKFHGSLDNYSLYFPMNMKLPSVKKIYYDVTNFEDISNTCEITMVLIKSFCSIFGSLESFVSSKCLLFQDFFNLSKCKTLTRLELKLKYPTNIFHTLNLTGRFPYLKVAKLYFNFTSGCPDLSAFRNLRGDTAIDKKTKFTATYCSNCPMIRRNVYCLRRG